MTLSYLFWYIAGVLEGFYMKQKNILIVDDDPITRTAVKTLVSNTYSVLEADSYDKALDLFNRNNISLVILDIYLKCFRSGIDLLTELNKLDSTTPIIMLSAASEPDIIVKCIKLGAYDYITKKDLINYDELSIKIQNCFSKELDKLALKGYEKIFDDNYPMIF